MKNLSKLLEETSVKNGRESGLNRSYLLSVLRVILDDCVRKQFAQHTRSNQRVKWARLAISACSAAGVILRDDDLDDIQQRIQAIEEKLS